MHNENKSYYVGLHNQGATCYLNSLLQTLFMTPEFRNAIYNWKWKPPNGKNDQCLLQQMQKLFVRLQICKKGAIDTKQFTNSLRLGWAFRPYEQRDAHDLLRYIFDMLEQIWQIRGNESELSPVQKFYRGKVDNYTKCTICGEEEVNHESFLDIPLAIRNFNSSAPFTNINESLSAYLQPQNLDNEEDFCEHCNRAGGLITGYRIKEFPRVLTLQLKRFEFVRHSMQRYKLNERIEFEEYLDLSNYIHKDAQNDDSKLSEYNDNYMEPIDCSNTEDACNSSTFHDSEVNMYELFAVIVHNGSLTGGHYFSYIRDLDADRWLCFNDSSVHSATLKEVFNNTFGAPDYQQYSTSSSSYWQNNYYGPSVFDDAKREQFMPISAFPPHLNAINEISEKECSWDTFRKSIKSKNCSTVSKKIALQNKNHQLEKIHQSPKQKPNYNDEDNNQAIDNDQNKKEQIDEKNVIANLTINKKGNSIDQNIEIILTKNKLEVMANVTLKNNCHEKQKKQEKKWSLIGNDHTSTEKLKKKNILERIKKSQRLLELTMDIIKKLEHIHLTIWPSANMMRSGERLLSELKINSEKLNFDLSPHGEIFSSISIHSALLTQQGRRLLTNWLNFLMYVLTLLKQGYRPWLNFMHYGNEMEKIQKLLQMTMDYLIKFAENVPKNEVKDLSTELCHNFKLWSSRTTLLMNMKNIKLTDKMIKKSELIQRVIFTMLCILFELNSHWSTHPSLETLLSYPWVNFLRMHRSELKFNTIEEYSPKISGNKPTSHQLLYHHFFALFHYNPPEEIKIFNNDSVAYFIANYQNYADKKAGTVKAKETNFLRINLYPYYQSL